MARKLAQANRFLGAVSDIDIRHLRVFRAVVERGGFTAAETELNIGRSTISIHIADLEKRLGMTLCDRGRNIFRLTEQGEIVYKATLEVFNALERFRGQVNAAHAYLAGELRIGYFDQLSSHPEFRLVDALRCLRETAPLVRVSLRITALDEIEQEVLDEKLDFGIVAPHRQLPGLEYRDFIYEEQRLYCGIGHPLFGKSDAAISREQVIACEHAFLTYASNIEMFGKKSGIEPAALADGAEALTHLILTGSYVGVLPSHYAEQWTKQGTMRALLPKTFSVRQRLKIVVKSGYSPGSPAAHFLEELYRAHGM